MPRRPAPPVEDGPEDAPIAALRRISDARRALERDADAEVRRARLQGHSWQAIAAALGVTKQAVHRKYGRT